MCTPVVRAGEPSGADLHAALLGPQAADAGGCQDGGVTGECGGEGGEGTHAKPVIVLEDEEEEEKETADSLRVVSTLSLAMMAFFVTSGGPFGIEAAVKAAGPLWVLVGNIVFPLCFALPQALVTAELSMLFPENGGYVIWIQQVFGDFWGFMNAWNAFIGNMISTAMYPVLFMSYLENQLHDAGPVELWAIEIFLVVFVCGLNIVGIEAVGVTSIILTVVTLSPFMVEFSAIPHMQPSDWLITPKHYHWSMYLSTMIWNYQGWDSLGCIAGEIKDGQKTFPRGIALSISVIAFFYIFPVAVGVSYAPNPAEWHPGFLAKLAGRIYPWLFYWCLYASYIGSLGQYNVSLSTTSRALWAMAGGTPLCPEYLPRVLSWSFQRYNTPAAAIIFQSVGICALMRLSWDQLVQLSVFLTSIRVIFEFGAFVVLRHRQPDARRPFKVPGGIFVAYLISIPSCTIVLGCMYLTPLDSLAIIAIINACLLVLFFLRCFRKPAPEPEELIAIPIDADDLEKVFPVNQEEKIPRVELILA
eukprot:gnl/Hemi2/20037_TR6647_c0_g1_i1.p1 gnl/Hemi2/20037_TR6647_c0_g1~~gnl/Hemi2/20037_TR6647_c0_g1_i1.p1  ORF type:complete len:530 (-),score=110.91 gnl/Hemi2/20037_TR6647_c0_g1_i1:73-1662(-)